MKAIHRAFVYSALVLCAGSVQAQDAENKDFSQAEKLLFTQNQLGALRLPTSLRYGFKKTGSLEAGFEELVVVNVRAQEGGGCCAATAEFFTGPRRMGMPEVESATGNPVLMYFLEREVREMQRLTKGSQSHFRKRLRMAFFNAATVRDLSLRYQGRDVAGQEVLVTPYLDDPNRARFVQLAPKQYRFWLSAAVPGGVFGIRTEVPQAAAATAPKAAAGAVTPAAPLWAEELWLEGAQAPKLPS
jgi:hypothetical protein